MDRKIILAIAIVCAAAQVGIVGQSEMADWLTDGGDPQRTAWQKNERILNVSNVKGMKLLWKYKTDNEPREMHALFPPLIVGRVNTSAGPKQVAVVAGISDNIYAIDVATGSLLWKHHFDTTFSPPPGVSFGTLCPGGQLATPVIGPGRTPGSYVIYAAAWDGRLHQLDVASGKAVAPSELFMPPNAKPYGLNLWKNVVYTTSAQGCGGNPNYVYAFDLATRRTATFDPGSGGMWGRSGPSIGKDGTVYTGTGDGSVQSRAALVRNRDYRRHPRPQDRCSEAEGLFRSPECRIPAQARHRSAGDRAGV